MGGAGASHAAPVVGAVIYSLVYVSAAEPAISRFDLRRILDQSRSFNAANSITGLLLYRTTTFLQFLEGFEEVIEALFARIEVDGRHEDVTVVRRGQQRRRQFPSWSMAFGDVDPHSASPVSVEMPPPDGPAPQTAAEAAFILELLDLFDS